MLQQLDSQGYAIAPAVLDRCTIESLLLAVVSFDHVRSTRRGEVYGIRDLLSIEGVRALARSTAIRKLVEPIAGKDALAVRGIFFDKTPEANWPVIWHQDMSIAVAEEYDLPGWKGWSVKNGVNHVQPPANILERMVTLRLHLDDCGADNGPLKVCPGSHRLGRLDPQAIRSLRDENGEAICAVHAGDAVVMRPLLLHASSPAAAAHHRRVIHLEFAPVALLPDGVRWAFA